MIKDPPDGPPRILKFENGSEINVVRGDILNLECLVTGGNPRPRLGFILDPPHHVAFTLKNIFGIWVNVTNSVSVIEERSLYISVSADSKPPVSKIEWNGLMLSDGSSLNITSIRRDQAGPLMCNVFNTMVSTDSNRTVIGSSSSVLQIDVLCKTLSSGN